MAIKEESSGYSSTSVAPQRSGDDRERQLVHAYLDGDVDAFSIIADEHYDSLKAQARRLLGPVGQPEDAVQETFERALKGIWRLTLTGDYRLRPWLGRILWNVCSDQRTRTSRHRQLTQIVAAQPDHEPDVADRVADPQTVRSLRAALHRLPAPHLRAFVLHDMEGLSYADLAEVENISEANARARVSRSRSYMRRALGDLQRRRTGLGTSAGGVLSLPILRSLSGLGRRLSKLSRLLHRTKNALTSAEPFSAPTGTASLVDRVASQVVVNPIGQSALALATSAPRGTFVIGLAATVATISASTALLHDPASRPAVEEPASTLVAANAPGIPGEPPNSVAPQVAVSGGASVAPVTPRTPTVLPAAVNDPSAYGWVNIGTPAGGAPTDTVPVASLAAASCTSTNGVTPPGPGFSVGTPLDMANALSVGSTPTSVLPTTGSSLNLNTTLTVSSFSGDSTGNSYPLNASACVSSSGWLTAAIGGAGNLAIDLSGTLEAVIGHPGDLGYVFRGAVTDAAGQAPSLLDGTQFVAQVVVTEPANTAQLTVVFLSPDAQPEGTASHQQSSGNEAPGTGTGTGAGSSAAITGPSGTAAPDPSGDAIGATPGIQVTANDSQPGLNPPTSSEQDPAAGLTPAQIQAALSTYSPAWPSAMPSITQTTGSASPNG